MEEGVLISVNTEGCLTRGTMSLSSCYLLHFGWLPQSLQMVAENEYLTLE